MHTELIDDAEGAFMFEIMTRGAEVGQVIVQNNSPGGMAVALTIETKSGRLISGPLAEFRDADDKQFAKYVA